MNRFQMPNIPPQQPFQMLSSGHIVLEDIIRYIPPNYLPGMPVDAIKGLIPSTVYIDGWHYTAIFDGGCGHYLTTAPNDKQFPRLAGNSWTGQLICSKHMRTCALCGLSLCTSGRADGLKLDLQNGLGPLWYCTPHYKEEAEKLESRIFRGDLLRGFLGGEK